MLREFQTRLTNGQVFAVVAFSLIEVPSLIADSGVASREEIANIRCVGPADDEQNRQQVLIGDEEE
jgi:hypothetical protein